MLLLSIIVPVFNNTEEDIERCVNSLQNAYSIKNEYEIVLIDDGSHEDCAKFLDTIAGRFSNIRVFHQENLGVSSARNFGIREALGKYVAFVDVDDIVSSFFIPNAMWAISHTEVDIIYGYVLSVNDIPKIDLIDSCVKNEVVPYFPLSQKDQQELYYHLFDLSRKIFWCGKNHISRGPVARIVRREMAKQIPFVESLRIGEDVVWNWELLSKAHSVGVIKKLWYYYIKNDFSSTQYLNRQSIEKYSDMLQYFQKYAKDDIAKSCLLNRTLSAGIELAKCYFLTERFSGNLFMAASEFNQLFSSFPWNAVMRFSFAKKSGWKCCVKYILLKTGLLIFVFKLKQKLFGK